MSQVISHYVPISSLSSEPYIRVLCYPSNDADEAAGRITELHSLEVNGIIFEGKSMIGKLNILGKGCVGVVVKAVVKDQEVALKIRRTDANRPDLLREASLLELANSVQVGPKFIGASRNFLLQEYVSGTNVLEWVRTLKGRGSVNRLRCVLGSALEQCHRLDKIGLDHGEISNLDKHLKINGGVRIIDFETASTDRRPANVTSCAQYLFIGGPVSKRTRKLLRVKDTQPMIDALRIYKHSKTYKTFSNLMEVLKVSD